MSDAVRDCLRFSCGFPAGMRERSCGGSLPIGEPHTATQPPQPNKPADRWQAIVALLAAHPAQARRLAELLERWPAEVRRHELLDHVQLRRNSPTSAE